MSRGNVEVVRRGLEVFQAEGMDAWLEQFVARDVVYVQDASVLVPDAQTWFGWEGWRASLAVWMDEFDDWEAEFHEVLDAGDGRVVVVWSDRGRGKRSGVMVERPKGAFVHTLHDGKIVHTVQYGLVEDALEAVGLSE